MINIRENEMDLIKKEDKKLYDVIMKIWADKNYVDKVGKIQIIEPIIKTHHKRHNIVV